MAIRSGTLALFACLVALLVPGCLSDRDDGGAPTTSRSTAPSSPGTTGIGGCSLDTHDVPARVTVNETFQVDVTLE